MRVLKEQWYRRFLVHADGDPNLLSTNRNDDGSWLNAYNDRPDNKWNRANGFAFAVSQLFSFLSCLHRGVLLCELAIPTAEHLTDLFEYYRYRDVFLIIERLGLPENHEQYLCRIELSDGEAYPRLFLCPVEKCCDGNCLDQFDEERVNLLADRVSMGFGKRLMIAVPEDIG